MDELDQDAQVKATQYAIQHDAPAVLEAIQAAFNIALLEDPHPSVSRSARRSVLARLQAPTERAFEETLAAIRDELRGQVE